MDIEENKREKMSADERRDNICKLLESRGKVTVSELADIFRVTMQTIRRDLQELDKQNKLSKTHGKAVKYDSLFEPAFNARLEVNIKQKNAIGKMATEIIKNCDAFACDSTTTVYSFLYQLENRQNISLFINSLIAAKELLNKFLSGSLSGKLCLLGGEIEYEDFMTYGPFLDQELDQLFFDKAIIGAGGVDIQFGLSAFSHKVGRLAKKIMDRANEVILLVDSSKIEKRTLYKYSDFSVIDTIITTIDPPDEKWNEYIDKHGINWIKVAY